MPRVPQYQQQLRQDALRPVEARNVDVSSGIQAVARGLDNLGEGIDQMTVNEANRIDQEITTGWLKWDSENRRRFVGQDAGQYEVEAKAWWEKAKGQYAGKANPLALSRITQAVGRRQAIAMAGVADRIGVEVDRYSDDQAEATAQSTIEFGIDSGDVAGASDRVRQLSAEKGARKGWSTDLVDAQTQKWLATLHLGRLEQLTSQPGGHEAAQAYLDANKHEIPAAQQLRAEQVIKTAGDDQFAADFAAEQAGNALSDQLKAALGITDAGRREKAMTAIKSNYALERQLKAEQQEQVQNQVYQMFEQGAPIPPALLSQMDGPQRSQFENLRMARADRLANGRTVKTNAVAYLEVRSAIERGEKVDLRQYTESIGVKDIVGLAGIQSQGGGNQDSLMTDAQRQDAALQALGIKKKHKPDDAFAVLSEIDRRTREASSAKGDKPLSPDEKQAIIDGVVADKVYIDDWGSDTEKSVVLLDGGEPSEAYVNVTIGGEVKKVKISAVPADDRMRIIAARKRLGLPVTEKHIVQFYVDAQKKPEGKQ